MSRLSLAILGSLFLVVAVAPPSADAAEIVAGGNNLPPAAPPPEIPSDTYCSSSQNPYINSGLGIQGVVSTQGTCEAGNPGEPGNLKGFAIRLPSCQGGFVIKSTVHFRVSSPGDVWHLYIWRDLGGLPWDACGMECASAFYKVINNAGGWQNQDWFNAGCPCMTFDQEILYVGAVYTVIDMPPDWLIGREQSQGHVGTGFANITGDHGDWVDLNEYGYGNLWGAENIIDVDCGAVPAEGSSWGAVKALYLR